MIGSEGFDLPAVVLVAGAAPYLGGWETWRRLIDELDGVRCIVLDPLDDLAAPDVAAAMHGRIASEILAGASAIVAHGTAARVAVEAAHATASDVAILLLDPLLVVRATRRAAVVRAALIAPIVGRPIASLLSVVARRKLVRVRRDRGCLERQLRNFYGTGPIEASLLDEAAARVADPRCDGIPRRTAELAAEMLRPIDPAAMGATSDARRTLVAEPCFAKHASRSMAVTHVPSVDGAPMIAGAPFVAANLREMLDARLGRAPEPSGR